MLMEQSYGQLLAPLAMLLVVPMTISRFKAKKLTLMGARSVQKYSELIKSVGINKRLYNLLLHINLINYCICI